MTQVQKTKEMLATLEKGTVLTREEYRALAHEFSVYEYKGKFIVNTIEKPKEWEWVIQNADKYGVERIEIFHKVPTSKVTTVDVLEMVKNGCSVEEIEKAVYTTTTEIRIKIK